MSCFNWYLLCQDFIFDLVWSHDPMPIQFLEFHRQSSNFWHLVLGYFLSTKKISKIICQLGRLFPQESSIQPENHQVDTALHYSEKNTLTKIKSILFKEGESKQTNKPHQDAPTKLPSIIHQQTWVLQGREKTVHHENKTLVSAKKMDSLKKNRESIKLNIGFLNLVGKQKWSLSNLLCSWL